jgi:hypothetical protein
VSDPLVGAIDAAREQRPTNLHDIVGWMILKQHRVPPEVLNALRSEVYMGIAKLLHKNEPSRDIARQLPKIIKYRFADYFEAHYGESGDGSSVISMEALGGYEPASPIDVAAIVEEHAVIDTAESVLIALRDSENECDRRDYQILEAHIAGALDKVRLQEIMGKEVTDTYKSTLLHRAKQRFESVYKSAGGRGVEV